MNREHTDRKKERGLTLVEVLVAFFILFVVTLAVLQLLSMAYLVNLGSMVRSDLTYRAERIVETIRLQKFRMNIYEPINACCPVGMNSEQTISPPPDVGCAAFWGPNGANVVEPNPRFGLSYVIRNNSVTVLAVPLKNGADQYLGPAATKAVVYVAQLQ
jgi:Tfp pilus assembly protein PilV